MKKYLLDTNIYIDNPESFYEFRQNGDNEIVVPSIVLKELDGLKKEHKTARDAIKILETEVGKFTLVDFDNDSKGITCDDGIIFVAQKTGATLITRDRIMRIKARYKKVKVEDYNGVKILELPNMFSEHETQFQRENGLLMFKGQQINDSLFKFRELSLNEEQKCAIMAMRDSDIPLIAINGVAGTGKTMLALLYAIEAVILKKTHSRIIVTRSPEPFVKDIGLLPGDVEEKMAPWLFGLQDNFDFLQKVDSRLTNIEFLDTAEIRALAHIRGSSLDDAIIIVDEVQNLHPKDMSTIVARTGKNSKMILLGDIRQVDSPYLSKEYNGLIHTITRMYGNPLFSYINLVKSMRSKLAETAAEVL
jgi:predicted ribonuclease YlaK